MPAAYLMSWEPKNRRWWKMENGRRYVVSVRQLRKHFGDETIPDTKEGSYTFANRWWRERAGTPVGGEAIRWMEAHDLDTGEPTGVFMKVTQSEIDHRLARHEELRQGLRALLDSQGTASVERIVGAQVDRSGPPTDPAPGGADHRLHL